MIFKKTNAYAVFNNHMARCRHPEFLTFYKPEELSKHDVYLSEDLQSGFWLSEDGEIGNLFSLNQYGKETLQYAISLGGKHLYCFDGFLRKYYESFGFTVYRYDLWNDAYAPQGWDFVKNGKPSVISMYLYRQYDDNTN